MCPKTFLIIEITEKKRKERLKSTSEDDWLKKIYINLKLNFYYKYD